MSAILHGFSINTSGSPRRLAQRDTEAYWRRLLSLGGTDINANDEVQNVEAFLMGGYDLVSATKFLIWTFRSGQSAGTGALAPPLTGGPAFTLVNGPSWAADGFVLGDAQNLTQQPGSVLTLPAFTLMHVRRIGSNAASNHGARSFYNAWNFKGFHGGIFTLQEPVGQAATAENRATDSIINAWRMVAGSYSLSQTFAGASGSLSAFSGTARPLSASHGSLIVSSRTGFPNTNAAIIALQDTTLTSSQFAAIYSLYKSTLGQGLGLP